MKRSKISLILSIVLAITAIILFFADIIVIGGISLIIAIAFLLDYTIGKDEEDIQFNKFIQSMDKELEQNEKQKEEFEKVRKEFRKALKK